MIQCYTWTTPNGYKIPIMLEEAQIPYELKLINIGKGEQHTDEYRKINPNEKIPAIIDAKGAGGEPLTVFESGAVLWYLAKKSGKLIPEDVVGEYRSLSWLFFSIGSIGPMLGQHNHFKNNPDEEISYAVDRYTRETERLLRVLDRQLVESEYLAGEYSIADIATWSWVRFGLRPEVPLSDYPHVLKWVEAIGDRPAVARAVEKLSKAKEEKNNS